MFNKEDYEWFISSLCNLFDEVSELDAKQKVLVAFYIEYQKDLPNIRELTPETVGIEKDEFSVAIQKLENEGMLIVAAYVKGGRGSVPLAVFTDNIMVTGY